MEMTEDEETIHAIQMDAIYYVLERAANARSNVERVGKFARFRQYEIQGTNQEE